MSEIAEPDTSPNRKLATTFEAPSPPRRRPTKACAKSTSSFAIPAECISFPDRISSGMAMQGEDVDAVEGLQRARHEGHVAEHRDVERSHQPQRQRDRDADQHRSQQRKRENKRLRRAGHLHVLPERKEDDAEIADGDRKLDREPGLVRPARRSGEPSGPASASTATGMATKWTVIGNCSASVRIRPAISIA